MIQQMKRVTCNNGGIQETARVIMSGGIAIFPTDTVYGIGCNPYDIKAVRRIYLIKNRERSKPLPILAKSVSQAAGIIQMDDSMHLLVDKFWPGPLTIISRAKDPTLAKTVGDGERLAVRVPTGRCILHLLQLCNVMVGTSANRSGEPAVSGAEQVSIEGDILLDGGIAGGTESTILDFSGGKVVMVRKGVLGGIISS